MDTTEIEIPFVYTASIIKPKCRKATEVLVSDTHIVKVHAPGIDEYRPAFKVGDQITHICDGQRLWTQFSKDSFVDLNMIRKLNSKEYNVSLLKNRFSDPFYHGSYRYERVTKSINHAKHISDIAYRKWVIDDRDAITQMLDTIASKLLVAPSTSEIMRETAEPVYSVTTFGLGNNHGGTALFIVNYSSDTTSFNALELDLALKYAKHIATQRGDTKSIVNRTNCGNTIEVLHPKAVRAPSRKSLSYPV